MGFGLVVVADAVAHVCEICDLWRNLTYHLKGLLYSHVAVVRTMAERIDYEQRNALQLLYFLWWDIWAVGDIGKWPDTVAIDE